MTAASAISGASRVMPRVSAQVAHQHAADLDRSADAALEGVASWWSGRVPRRCRRCRARAGRRRAGESAAAWFTPEAVPTASGTPSGGSHPQPPLIKRQFPPGRGAVGFASGSGGGGAASPSEQDSRHAVTRRGQTAARARAVRPARSPPPPAGRGRLHDRRLGATFQNWLRYTSHTSSIASARRLAVRSKCSRTSSIHRRQLVGVHQPRRLHQLLVETRSGTRPSRRARTRRRWSCPRRSCGRFRRAPAPCRPSCTRSRGRPTPSTTASRPSCARRSARRHDPRRTARPPVAPYRTVLPTIVFLCGANRAMSAGITTISPPLMPLPT